MSCPSFAELLPWLAAAPHSEQQEGTGQALDQHVHGGCPTCRRRMQMLDSLACCIGQPAPPEVPADLRSRVLQAFAAADGATGASQAEPAPGPVERLGQALGRLREFVAERIEPQLSPSLATGLRGEGGTGLQHFQAGPFQLDVGLVERRSVLGQLGDGSSNPARELAGASAILCGPDGSRETEVDPDGGFRFQGAGPGRYALLIESGSVRLMFPDVDLAGGQH